MDPLRGWRPEPGRRRVVPFSVRKSGVPFKHHAARRHHIPKPRYRVTNWPERFPGSRHVSFDETTYDLTIDGKLRRNNGKGVRAITHAAFKVALLLFCRERDLPHPGFLVLDTPLLTYRDPITSKYGDVEGDEKELSNTSLKPYFFDHLSSRSDLAQFIILENVDPPDDIGRAHVETFCGDRAGGRPGLFPAII
jgi:hypothetical protein